MSDNIISTNANASAIDRRESVENKHCWVCFATEEDDYLAQWVSPCKCRGTAKWVHKTCLQRWIDEKQQGNSSVEVACPQCNTTYIIVYPRSDIVVKYLDIFDRLLNKICPILAGGILLGSIYWTAVSYGALTIMCILDQKDALSLMESADPLMLLIGLPLLPTILILTRFIRWEDSFLRFWRKHSTKLFGLSFQNSTRQNLPRRPNTNFNNSYSDPVSLTRTVCGGLVMPVVATMVGKLFPSKISNLKRFVLGSLAYLGIKGILKLYYKQKQYLRQAFRQIKSFESLNDATTANTLQHRVLSVHSYPINNNNENNNNNNNNNRLPQASASSSASSASSNSNYSE